MNIILCLVKWPRVFPNVIAKITTRMLRFGFLPYLTQCSGTKKASIMSEVRAPQPAVGEEEARPVSQQPSTSSARMQQEPQPILEAGDVGSPDSVSSSADVDIMSAAGGEQARPVSPQPSTSSAGMQQSLPILEAGDDGSADSGTSSVDTEIMSFSASAARSRPWSPQPSTSSARVQPILQPFVKASKTIWSDQVLADGAQNYRTSWADRERRPWSPQPSTSSAPVVMEPELQPFFSPDDLTDDHMYARDLSIRRAPMGSWESRASSPQPSTSSAGMQFEMQPFVKATDAKPADSTDSESVPQNISAPWERMRPWSPNPLTSSAAMMLELELLPVNTEGGASTSTDSEYSRLAQNISAPLEGERPWSPQPSTSADEKFTLKPSEIPVISLDDDDDDDVIRPIVPTTVQSIDYSTKRGDRNISIPVYKRLRRWSTSELRPPTKPGEASSLDSGAQNTSPWSPQPSTSTDERFMWKPSEIPVICLDDDDNDDDVTGPNVPTTVQSIDYSTKRGDRNIRGKLRRWPPQQLTTPAQRALLEMQALKEADVATSANSDLSCFDQNLSVPAGEGKKRPWSPQPSTSREALMQLKLMPLMEAIDSKADSFSLSVVQNISALVEESNLRPLSPQPSTSSAPMQPVKKSDEKPADDGSSSAAQNINASGPAGEGIAPPSPEPSTSSAATMEVELPPVKKAAQKNSANSVYAHVPHNISNIPQLRGLKAGRRHGRLRRLNMQNKLNAKYGPVIEYIGPMVAEERAKHQTQQILIASALDHFANTINQIADKYEGKVDTTGFTERLEAFKKRMEDRREKRRKRNPNATEEPLPRPPSPPKLSDEEMNRRLREETEAAVEALLTGDRSKECPPDRFAEIIKSFQEAFNPPSK